MSLHDSHASSTASDHFRVALHLKNARYLIFNLMLCPVQHQKREHKAAHIQEHVLPHAQLGVKSDNFRAPHTQVHVP